MTAREYRERRGSGIDWIGSIPSHWTIAPIRLVARLESGHTPSRSKPEYWVPEECTIPWISLADVWQLREGTQEYIETTSECVSATGLAHSAARLLPAQTVILSRTASVGFSGIMAQPMATTQDFVNWVCGPRVRPAYLLYVFRGMHQEFRRLTMGSTHQTIYMPDVRGFRMPLPPVEEQDEIVENLRSRLINIDELIRKKEHLIELLQKKRQALITQAVTKGLDPIVPWSREIPAKRLYREIDRRLGEIAGDRPPLLSVSIHHGVRHRSEVTDREPRSDEFATYKLCEAGDIVINRMRAFQGAVGISPTRGIVSPDYAVLRMNSSLNARYFHYLFRSQWFVGEMTARLRGIGSSTLGNVRTPRINIQDLGGIRLCLPSVAEQKTIADALDQQTQRISDLLNKNTLLIERLREYRQALISAAVTGQIDVTQEAAA